MRKFLFIFELINEEGKTDLDATILQSLIPRTVEAVLTDHRPHRDNQTRHTSDGHAHRVR